MKKNKGILSLILTVVLVVLLGLRFWSVLARLEPAQ